MQSTIHEMRNQLAVAIANVEAFIDEKFKPTPDRLNAVLRALREVDVLINDLRPSGPVQPRTAMVTTDVCDLILSELVAMEPAASAAGVELKVDRCSQKHQGCAAFVCDPGQVSQIVKNVMLNAIKYTPAGGHVDVECHREPGVLALSVSDDGPGVPRDERTAIFEPGVRGSGGAGVAGSGMGLAVVKRIIDTHGGTLSVDDSSIGGARFSIRLPGTVQVGSPCSHCSVAG